MTGVIFSVVLELVPLSGEKKFKPRPQNRILVPLRGSFQNFWPAPLAFLHGSALPPPGNKSLYSSKRVVNQLAAVASLNPDGDGCLHRFSLLVVFSCTFWRLLASSFNKAPASVQGFGSWHTFRVGCNALWDKLARLLQLEIIERVTAFI